MTSGPWEVFKEARETERASWKGQTIQKAMTSEGMQGPSHLELLGAEQELEILTLLKWLASSTLLTSELLSAWSHITGTKKQNDPNLATHISGQPQEREAMAGLVGGLKCCFLFFTDLLRFP